MCLSLIPTVLGSMVVVVQVCLAVQMMLVALAHVAGPARLMRSETSRESMTNVSSVAHVPIVHSRFKSATDGIEQKGDVWLLKH